ncbi:MAG: Crp/Fnr family transcriptional regulator [Nitrospiraceae bacterium]|nr:MAG: Crp/Fnr family transcriptional regulator [Nitrospiraceae bacterium]
MPIFHNLSEHALKMLERILIRKTFAKSENIFSEGDESAGFYILIKGRVKVFKLSMEGKEQILHIMEAKELLGAVSAFAGNPYPAHADAIEKTEAFFFPRNEFVSLVKREPSVVMNIMANLSMRLQHFTNMIENLSLKEVPGRLGAYLLYLCKRTGCGDTVEMDISKGQLASFLGTSPETLSRIFKKMSEKNILEIKGRSVRILRRKDLKDIVDGEKVKL